MGEGNIATTAVFLPLCNLPDVEVSAGKIQLGGIL